MDRFRAPEYFFLLLLTCEIQPPSKRHRGRGRRKRERGVLGEKHYPRMKNSEFQFSTLNLQFPYYMKLMELLYFPHIQFSYHQNGSIITTYFTGWL
jgi:hypothetical protein